MYSKSWRVSESDIDWSKLTCYVGEDSVVVLRAGGPARHGPHQGGLGLEERRPGVSLAPGLLTGAQHTLPGPALRDYGGGESDQGLGERSHHWRYPPPHQLHLLRHGGVLGWQAEHPVAPSGRVDQLEQGQVITGGGRGGGEGGMDKYLGDSENLHGDLY